MPKSQVPKSQSPRFQSPTVERIKSVLVALVLIGIVGYFALTSIPSAERPSLHAPTNSPATPATHTTSSR